MENNIKDYSAKNGVVLQHSKPIKTVIKDYFYKLFVKEVIVEVEKIKTVGYYSNNPEIEMGFIGLKEQNCNQLTVYSQWLNKCIDDLQKENKKCEEELARYIEKYGKLEMERD